MPSSGRRKVDGDVKNRKIRAKEGRKRQFITHRILVTIIDPLQQLIQMLLGSVLPKSSRGRIQLVQQRVVEVLEHEVEASLATEHLDHVHQVLVAELL